MAKNDVESKGTVFFFSLIKFMDHSFYQIVKMCFFLFREVDKKIQGCIFFSSKSSWAIHSGFGRLFFILFERWVYFFFSTFLGFFCVLFISCKSSHVIHGFDFEAVFFPAKRTKKNTQLFHSSNWFSPKICEKLTFTGKKKKSTIPLLKGFGLL